MKNSLIQICLSCLLLVGVWAYLFLDFFPNNNGNLGHDYAYFFPRLLAGYYWFSENGFTSIPYFSPAFCGGAPFYVNPQDLYFSIPQFLSFITNPLNAVIATFIVFAVFGYIGCYLLLKYVFHCSTWATILGATLFLFNDFYIYRIVIGHLTFHGFMLTPIIAFFLLYKVKRNNLLHDLCFAVLASISVSYIIYSGGVNVLLPIAFAVLAIILIIVIKNKPELFILKRMLLTIVITLMLSASKIVAAISTMQQLSRDAYPLPGIDSILQAIYLPFKLLFISAESNAQYFTNMQWLLSRHEFEYGVTLVPLAVFLIWLTSRLRNNPRLPIINQSSIFYFSGLILILCIPIVLNFYTPSLNATFKSIPILKSSSSMVRWYLIYIPIVVVLTSIAFDCIKLERSKAIVATMLIGMVILSNAYEDKNYYHNQPYDTHVVLENYDYLKNGGEIKSITQIRTSSLNKASFSIGVSRLNCYEALFGYRHEFFPQKNRLTEGEVMQISDGFYNMKNPSCYTYPIANHCQPGDHFTQYDEPNLKAFLAYMPFKFEISSVQKTANIISTLTLLILLLIISVICIKFIYKSLSK